ncbi:50S ribosomal protein L6 [Candidatus Roizmanbacteria bacterium CG22_combo_CG10-13_8_21_14_all_35_9]|uniref:50S ribosomal protein L6 n=3 Tax=Candidatus Roizmaniibacteriota TaxID=1752723 RepID=A0A2M8F4N5_9BACT|nr:MAG: 50S ribosomal protein L6 [Candidatus Roizmanbacteria bacterium CG23_combo_of_CG06-09_8_20_14_all_35_49]PIP62656.1 MAG: 50S ribosomal protein L6 [Candidatus Roizmanbacteria bacterium CG22_combo_CG10-13_8_21_14_all_35_9]PJC34247.1 MAG: 50S ribosomal protein L6 [Candidatus Roizmanbacteria bacterium CG_4_9_14_0_2_um_filter_35_15]PJC82609.1 MAG: 50S ribosomal protein L6 [Candidatus Roizmanbacteria bacterium CG_4_8_14_3_um_filter_35_14]
MSKIGTKVINWPSQIKIEIEGKKVTIKGSAGEMTVTLPESLSILQKESSLVLQRTSEEKKIKSLHGLYRQLINNAVIGVEKPWEKQLEIVGTGYNVKLQGEDLVFKVGYIHPVVFKKPAGVKFQTEGNNKIKVIGVDKQLVGQVAFQIKMIKKPDVYKGKGIKYLGEKLRIKPGKKAKAAGPVTQ